MNILHFDKLQFQSSFIKTHLYVRLKLYCFKILGIFHLRVPESSAVGSAVGRIKAHDLDIGKNAEVEYNIVPGDGGSMFDITTNEHNQEGIIMLKKVRYQL